MSVAQHLFSGTTVSPSYPESEKVSWTWTCIYCGVNRKTWLDAFFTDHPIHCTGPEIQLSFPFTGHSPSDQSSGEPLSTHTVIPDPDKYWEEKGQ